MSADRVLAAARTGLVRRKPLEAADAVREGNCLVHTLGPAAGLAVGHPWGRPVGRRYLIGKLR